VVPEERPPDLMVAATVLAPGPVEKSGQSGVGGVAATAAWPRALRAARYVIEADGDLRAVQGEDAGVTAFPPRTRQLTAAEMDQLWHQLVGSGLLAKNAPGHVDGPEDAVASPTKSVALIYTSFDGKRRTVRVVMDRSTEEAVEAERVVDRLAGWAWER
jgi:hypothetical protein